MKELIDGLTSELERTNELIQKFARYIETFEVNGRTYRQLQLFGLVKAFDRYWTSNELIEEYQLIQKKQSKLPRAKRDWIVNKFHTHFQELPENFVKYLGQPLQA